MEKPYKPKNVRELIDSWCYTRHMHVLDRQGQRIDVHVIAIYETTQVKHWAVGARADPLDALVQARVTFDAPDTYFGLLFSDERPAPKYAIPVLWYSVTGGPLEWLPIDKGAKEWIKGNERARREAAGLPGDRPPPWSRGE